MKDGQPCLSTVTGINRQVIIQTAPLSPPLSPFPLSFSLSSLCSHCVQHVREACIGITVGDVSFQTDVSFYLTTDTVFQM